MSTESILDFSALQANRNIEAKKYWEQRMKGFEVTAYFNAEPGMATDRHSDKPYASTVSTAGQDVYDALKNLAESHKARHIVLLSTLGILAKKYASCDDVCIFTPEYAAENCVGNIVPVRMNAFARTSFAQFLTKVKEDLLLDLRYSNYPLTKILKKDDQELEEMGNTGMLLTAAQDAQSFEKFPVDLFFMFDMSESLTLTIKYAADKFAESTIARLGALYFNMLHKLVVNTNVPVRDVTLVSLEERRQIMNEFNNTQAAFPKDKTLIDFFITQAHKHPEHIAVRSANGRLSYHELDERSNQVANYLRERSQVKGTIVAVELDRSLDLIITIFGILKAGCVYMPMTRSHPPERIRYMLNNSSARIVFSERERFDASFGEEFECVEVADTVMCSKLPVNLARPEDVAYIIYTSGSTGRPKGVLIKHASVVNRLNWMQNSYRLNADDVILQKTPIVFDVSIWELFWWAMYGAQLYLVPPGAEKEPNTICETIHREKISVLHFVPSMLSALVNFLNAGDRRYAFNGVRHVFASGEELKSPDAYAFLSHFPEAELHNLYGPTEATVDVSFFHVSRSDRRHRIPIGRPIDNTQLLILNNDLQLQPVGVSGELFIGGVNLSLGYLNQVELTNEKFIHNPYHKNSFLYRTGDLARWLPDGNIEFLGRIDNQVKIRGNRIELSEIEFHTERFKGVKNAIVLADKSGETSQLVSYVIATDFSEDELRAYLLTRLPDYMVPSFFVEVEEFPVTINGKVDVQKLLSLPRYTSQAHVEPESVLEREISVLWQDILKKEKISVEDDFFRIGGDSILAVRLIGAINYAMSVNLSMADLFGHTTIRSLADFIATTRFADHVQEYKSIEAELALFNRNYLSKYGDENIEVAYPMSDIEQAMCFVQQANRDDIIYFEQFITPVRIRDFDACVLRKAIALLIEKHPILRTGFDLNEFAHIVYKRLDANVCFHDLIGLNAQDQRGAIAGILEENRRKHFDLSVPLWRITLCRVSAHDHALIFENHHAILDGWSHSSLLTELNNTVVDLIREPSLTLLPLASHYGDFIASELYEKKNQEALSYWKAELKDFKKFKINDTSSAAKAFRSARMDHAFPDVKLLEATAKRENTTSKNILLSAFLYTMRILSCESDILVGLVTFSRPLKKDGEKILGCFLNTIPFRIKIPQVITWRAYLKLVGDKLLEVKKYESPSLMEISKALNTRADEGNPFFDTLFNFINFHIYESLKKQTDDSDDTDILKAHNFLRGHTLFDVSLHVNDKGIHGMYELVSPFMDEDTFEVYLKTFGDVVAAIINTPDRVIDAYETFWSGRTEKIIAELVETDVKADDDGVIQASPHQERLWFIDRFETGHLYASAPVYHNIPLILHFDDAVDAVRMEGCIRALLQRHAVLRSRIVTIDQGPHQKVLQDYDFTLRNDVVRSSDVDALIAMEINKPFSLDALLVRAVLLGVQEGGSVLIMVFHHIIVDRCSVNQISKELLRDYDRWSKEGKAPIESGVDLQYASFSKWQQRSLVKLDPYLLSRLRELLGTRLKTLELPTESPRAAIHTFTADSVDVTLGPELLHTLRLYEKRSGVAANILLMAVFKVLLHKYAQQEEVVIGTSVDNRSLECLDGVVGPIANLVIIKSFVSPELSFDDYVTRLHEIYEAALQLQIMPFDRLVKELAQEKDMSRTALFDVLYQYERSDIIDENVRIQEFNLGYGKYDLNILLQESVESVAGKLVFNQRYFSRHSIDLLVSRYCDLIGALLTHPDTRIADVEVIGEYERPRYLELFNNTAVDYPREKTVVDLFLEQTERTPDKIAVTCEGASMTYRELSDRSRKLASVLSNNGVTAGNIVGLFVDRSMDTIIGMIGILMAGGAYLPIDVDYPEERIRYLINDSGVGVVVTTKTWEHKMCFPIPIVWMDDMDDHTSKQGNTIYAGSPGDLCYVIYTSGTTGNPKGVMIEHRNVVRLLFNSDFQFDFDSNDVWTMFHSHCFDFSVWEIYGALLFGGRLVIVPKAQARNSESFLRLLKEEGVTILNQTPSAFYNLIQYELLHPDASLRLKYVIFGGEALSPGKLQSWKTKYPDVRLINMYGITETTVHVTYKEIGDHEITHNISNVGRPIPTLSVYLFDQHQKLVPSGTIGEIYVGGEGVARGYLGKEQLTAIRFIPNPYKHEERLYRSGDLARTTAEAEIEYIGRIDDQVQLMGFRIEPGEIESKLVKFDGIKESAVAVREKGEEKFLVAYYVSSDEISSSVLRNYLLDKLPEHMMPSYYVHMQQLPLTYNGKIDKKSLPPPRIELVEEYERPINEVQARLVAIWADVLGLEESKIGVNTNFFDIGGNSIKLMKLVKRINQQFNTEIWVAKMFEFPVIALMAEYLNGEWQSNTEASAREQDAGDVTQMIETVEFLNQMNK